MDASTHRPKHSIHRLASEAERNLHELADAWADLGDGQREETARLLARSSPGVLRLLCPDYGRFAAA